MSQWAEFRIHETNIAPPSLRSVRLSFTLSASPRAAAPAARMLLSGHTKSNKKRIGLSTARDQRDNNELETAAGARALTGDPESAQRFV